MILRNKNQVMEAVKGSASLTAMRLIEIREGPISDMEKLLMTWIEDQTQRCMYPSQHHEDHTKAKILFVVLKEKTRLDYDLEFTAISRSFKLVKNHYALHTVNVSGESADVKAAEAFLGSLGKLIVEENYLPEQIFHMVETPVCGKWMPERTVTNKKNKVMLGFKLFKDKRTVLLGGNTAGYKLKPSVIWHSGNPRTFKHINKHTHPVYYRSKKVVDDPAPHLRCPAELLCWHNGEICVWRITHLSRFCLLIMLPDILLLLVIFIPMSSSVSLSKHHLFGPTNRSRFIATLKSTA